jgi:hypothetical protein
MYERGHNVLSSGWFCKTANGMPPTETETPIGPRTWREIKSARAKRTARWVAYRACC